MNTEELLKPRFKVIADYPNSPFEVGSVLIQDMNTIGEVFVIASEVGETNKDRSWIHPAVPPRYPAIFRKMEWWEERELPQMPDYLKDIGDGEILRAETYTDRGMVYIQPNNTREGSLRYTNVHHFLPSTKEEYENQVTKPQT